VSSLLDKIRKLLALSKSANANEAAAAAAAAQRLMTEHQIAEAEVDDGELHEHATLSDDPLDTFGKRSVVWKEVLSSQLCLLHGCKVWRESLYDGPTVTRRLRIVGRASDVGNVRYLYAWLTSEVERLVQSNGKGRGQRYAYSYRVGAVNGCIAAMWAAHREVRAAATGAALVKVDSRRAESEAEAKRAVGHIKPARPASFTRDPDAYQRGEAAGRSLHTGAKLGAAGARLLGSRS
jgi:hypothetical protein